MDGEQADTKKKRMNEFWVEWSERQDALDSG